MTTIIFQIEYATKWGEILCLCYEIAGMPSKQFILETEDGRNWHGKLSVPPFTLIKYHYLVVEQCNTEIKQNIAATKQNDIIIVEQKNIEDEQSGVTTQQKYMKVLRTMRQGVFKIQVNREKDIITNDHWAANDIADVFLHTAFSKCIFKVKHQTSPYHISNHSSYICLHTTPPPTGFSWGIVGSINALGNWDANKAKNLTQQDTYEYILPLTEEDIKQGFEYKYILINNSGTSKPCLWEKGENRVFLPQKATKTARAIVNDGAARLEVQPWRGAGVVIPIFSLRSEGSQGIGDFGDLKHFIGWASSVGFKCVQILPINDTTSSATWRDSYPYNGISVFALHPIYLDLREWKTWNRFRHYEERAKQINSLSDVDYEKTLALKMDFLSELYLTFGEKILDSTAYQIFFKNNEKWLVAYACYCHEKAESLKYVKVTDQTFFYFVQFLLHRQMTEAHDAARCCNVILKGDIPIGVCADSVPATVCPQLFHFDGSAGAPPDDFAREGQNWGFPTYNWENMAKDGYSWWKDRLKCMEQYFDAYRIDHVLGFFRIWEVPSCQVQGLMGHFRPALPLSKEEIKSYGFQADIERYTHPFITSEEKARLEKRFPYIDFGTYLRQTGDNFFEPCENIHNQRSIAKLVCDDTLKKELMSLVSEILFIEDPDGKGFHPRILAHETRAFQTLDKDSQQAFHKMYEDFFYHRHNTFWAQKALEKMQAIMVPKGQKLERSMLPCAEDLGMVPASVKGVLEKLQILSLEIQRMPKKWGVRFDHLEDNPYLSVSTIATHDMPPFRLWWHENKEQTQAFYNDILHRKGTAPENATPEICEQIISEHLQCPSMLCLNSLQDYLAMDSHLRNPHYEKEQINVPSNPNQYWNYRMHLTIEQLIGAFSFNEKLRNLIQCSGR